MLVEARALGKSFRRRHSTELSTAIQSIDLTIPSGQIVAVVGKTGCGKSTFFNMLLGLEKPSAGALLLDGRSPHDNFDAFRGEIAVVFQDDRLLPWRTALSNVELGLEVLGVHAEERRASATHWLTKMGLEDYLHAYPNELSGGMRQRVSMARAFALKPKLILADEAFGHLDEITASQLRDEFVALVRDSEATAVFITHQLEEAITVPERVVGFGRPGTVLFDIRVDGLTDTERAEIKAMIQESLSTNSPSMSTKWSVAAGAENRATS
jgi:NitT/TauT family transport system ATP-binding protein